MEVLFPSVNGPQRVLMYIKMLQSICVFIDLTRLITGNYLLSVYYLPEI